jgi:hypothetical protein
MTPLGIIFSSISSSHIFNHAASYSVTVIATYSTSGDERATISCLCELHPIAISLIYITVPVWVRPLFPTPYNASPYIVTLLLDPAHIVCLSTFVLYRYCSTWITASQCLITQFALRCAN